MRPALVVSVLLHVGLAALAIVAALRREKPPEPLPPPAYAVEFEAGAPERPAEPESLPSPGPAEATEQEEPPPPPAVAEAPPPEPEPAEAPPEETLPPPPAVAEAPLPEPEPAEAPPEEPRAPSAPTVAEAPLPEPAPVGSPPDEAGSQPPEPEQTRNAEAAPARPDAPPIPLPPAPPPPQREAALTAPPRPARPPAPERLPGLYLPDLRLAPAPSRPQPQRRGLDLSPNALEQPGRDSPEAQLSIRGAQVGPDWRNAFRRWVNEHVRYPAASALLDEKGTSSIEVIVAPDGRVRSSRLVRRSGSVWLDHGTVTPFRNGMLPPFPPGADPDGVVINLTIYWVGQR